MRFCAWPRMNATRPFDHSSSAVDYRNWLDWVLILSYMGMIDTIVAAIGPRRSLRTNDFRRFQDVS
jgi:hypothetical protein